MAITSHPAKREKALAERGMDFDAAEEVFAGPCFSFEDSRINYGEVRIITIGLLAGRMVVIGWTQRGNDQHVFSMRKANEREQKKYTPLLR
ncbi:BrnT family toxin [Methylobacterium sp. E-045]|uniref:BrnT family toxin n=1 Tax=Methylobacterium sp. E-045 TaxID=2836575 RepID=UPI001FBB3DE7|nr:BrnT family toxin [Methylobacterium sp. E-045]MCJ2131330.1 BrnT family toxin [Methylobacterium sp. E-045]